MNGWQIGLILLGSFIMVMMARARSGPLRLVGKGILHVALGAVVLFVFNIFAGAYDFQIPLNLVTVSISGFLGIPGVLGLICIKLFVL